MVTSKMPFFSWMHDYNTKGVFRNLLMEISGPPNPGLINYCDLGKKKLFLPVAVYMYITHFNTC